MVIGCNEIIDAVGFSLSFSPPLLVACPFSMAVFVAGLAGAVTTVTDWLLVDVVVEEQEDDEDDEADADTDGC